jgi:hypothetical protein
MKRLIIRPSQRTRPHPRRLGPAVGCLLRSGCRADHLSEDAVEAPETIQNAWAGLKLVRTAIEQTCPVGVLPREEAVLLLYGPEPVHEGEALAKPLSR